MQPRLKIPSIAFRHLGRKYFGTFAAFLSLSGISVTRAFARMTCGEQTPRAAQVLAIVRCTIGTSALRGACGRLLNA